MYKVLNGIGILEKMWDFLSIFKDMTSLGGGSVGPADPYVFDALCVAHYANLASRVQRLGRKHK